MLLLLSKEGMCIKVLMRKTTEPLAPRVQHWVLPVAQLLAVMCIYLGVIKWLAFWQASYHISGWCSNSGNERVQFYFFSLHLVNKSTVYKVLIVLLGVASVIKPLSELIWHSLQSLSNTLSYWGLVTYSSSGPAHWLAAGPARRGSVQWALQDHREENIYLEYMCGPFVATSLKEKKI